ncbi:hypothetical protein GCM10023353_16960 [Tomitella cavernea]|uniref:Uncharacterized protein n=1 Tax=Tomitella cavernea TaxID=1387982 RepID=A0ABP9CQI6_9ACTN
MNTSVRMIDPAAAPTRPKPTSSASAGQAGAGAAEGGPAVGDAGGDDAGGSAADSVVTGVGMACGVRSARLGGVARA